jgi:hypothetical protein
MIYRGGVKRSGQKKKKASAVAIGSFLRFSVASVFGAEAAEVIR